MSDGCPRCGREYAYCDCGLKPLESEIDRLRAKLTAAEKVVEAAREYRTHNHMTVTFAMVRKLDEALRLYDAAKGGEDE